LREIKCIKGAGKRKVCRSFINSPTVFRTKVCKYFARGIYLQSALVASDLESPTTQAMFREEGTFEGMHTIETERTVMIGTK
jgi:hypothetical protein